MSAKQRSFQIIQGFISLALGCLSIVLSVTLRQATYSTGTLLAFLLIGLALIFTGDYLINLFKMPVTSVKQELASDLGYIGYGALYLNIALSALLQPVWISTSLPHFLQPIWVRRGVAAAGIVLIVGGINGLYKLWTELRNKHPE